MELPFWQLSAAFIALLFVLAAVAGVARYPRPVMGVLLFLLLALPTTGLVAYAIVPGPTPRVGPVLWLAFVPALAGVAAGVWMLAWMAAHRSTLTMANVEMLSNGTLVAFAGFVLAVSGLVALWQPGFALANVLLNCGWALAWAPRSLRRNAVEAQVDIGAPRARVYSFMAEPANWLRYQEGLEAVAVRPEGPLAPGTEVTVTQRYDTHVRGPQLLPGVMSTTSVVDVVEPERLLATHIKGRPDARSEWVFTEAGEGTAITARATAVAPYRMAIFGALVELRAQSGERRARARRTLERLKDILESS